MVLAQLNVSNFADPYVRPHPLGGVYEAEIGGWWGESMGEHWLEYKLKIKNKIKVKRDP